MIRKSLTSSNRFYENVNNGLVKNVEHIGKAEGGVEKYKII